MHIKEHNVRTRREHGAHMAVIQIQHIGDHLVLSTFEDPFVGALLQEHSDFLQGHGGLLHATNTEQAQHGVCRNA